MDPANKDRFVIIVVDDDPTLLQMLEAFFSSEGHTCRIFTRGEDALGHLATATCDIMLTDIMMPGMQGMELTERAKRLRPEINIITMTGFIDRFSYDDAVAAGASDFIKKPFTLTELTMRIRHVLLQEKLRVMSITDDLTGLPNRRGFFALAEHQLKAAARTNGDLALLFFDMDSFKEINDTWGHQEGDRALMRVADIFRQSFRESDIIARMGGDEFAVLLIDSPLRTVDVILERLSQNIDRSNEADPRGYKISVSSGLSAYDSGHRCSIDEMLRVADQLMYENKQKKKTGSRPS